MASTGDAASVVLHMQTSAHQDVSSNKFYKEASKIQAPLIKSLRARGPQCWDADFYLANNPDLGDNGIQADQAWEHFVTLGQFEDRPER